MSDNPLTNDEQTFRSILLFIDNARKQKYPLMTDDFRDNFDENIFQNLRRLTEKKLVRYVDQRQCYYITDLGIESLKTTYNPSYRQKQQHKELQREKQQKESALWLKIGVFSSIVLSIIALLKSFIII